MALWDEHDGLFYDHVTSSIGPGGSDVRFPLRIHSIVSLVPLFAVETIESEVVGHDCRVSARRFHWFLEHRPEPDGEHQRANAGRSRSVDGRLMF